MKPYAYSLRPNAHVSFPCYFNSCICIWVLLGTQINVHEIGALTHKISSVEMRDCVAKCRRGFHRVSTFGLTLQCGMWPNYLITINNCPVIITIGLLRCDIKYAFVISRFVIVFVLFILFVYFVIYYTCRTIVIFGTLKDDSLEINILLNIKQLFQSQEHLTKWRQHLLKMVNHFLSKSSKFCTVRTIRFCSFHQHVVQILIK